VKELGTLKIFEPFLCRKKERGKNLKKRVCREKKKHGAWPPRKRKKGEVTLPSTSRARGGKIERGRPGFNATIRKRRKERKREEKTRCPNASTERGRKKRKSTEGGERKDDKRIDLKGKKSVPACLTMARGEEKEKKTRHGKKRKEEKFAPSRFFVRRHSKKKKRPENGPTAKRGGGK